MTKWMLLVFLAALPLWADSPQKESVPGYFEAYFEKLNLKFCTENVEPAVDIGQGQKKEQHWSRKSSFTGFKRFNGNAFTVDYTAKVDMHDEILMGEQVVRKEPESNYLSTLRFEMVYEPTLEEYVGFARYTAFTKNGNPESQLGVAYAIRMRVAGGLEITAEDVTPRTDPNLKNQLALVTWQEKFRWDDGVMFRSWIEKDFKIDPKTRARLEEINSAISRDSSLDCN